MSKRILHMCIGFLLCIRPLSTVCAQSPVTIYTEHFPPYSFANENGDIVGAMTKLVEQVMAETGLPYKIRVEPWSRVIRNAQIEKNSLLYSLVRTEARSKKFDWLVPLTHEEFYLIGYKSDKRSVTDTAIKAGDFSAVCMQDDISCALLRSAGFPAASLIQFSSLGGTGNAASLMMSGRADFYPGTRHRYKNVLRKVGLDADIVELKKLLGNVYLFLAAGKQVTPEIKQAVIQAYRSLQKQGRYTPVDPEALHGPKS